MLKHSCVVVRAVSVAGACAVLALAAGCAPHRIHWMDSDPTIGPQAARPTPPSAPHGFLSIETQHFGEPGDEEVEKYPPVFLYDADGTLVSQLPNDTDTPMALRPGEYIVLVGESMDPMGEFRQVQVHVAAGKTTRVTQGEIDDAPTLWALFR